MTLDKKAESLLRNFLSRLSLEDITKEKSGELFSLDLKGTSYLYGNSELLAYTPTHTFVWFVDKYGDRLTVELFDIYEEK